VFKRLVDLGWDEGDIAKKAGLSRAYIGSLLGLQAAPDEVKQLVRDGFRLGHAGDADAPGAQGQWCPSRS